MSSFEGTNPGITRLQATTTHSPPLPSQKTESQGQLSGSGLEPPDYRVLLHSHRLRYLAARLPKCLAFGSVILVCAIQDVPQPVEQPVEQLAALKIMLCLLNSRRNTAISMHTNHDAPGLQPKQLLPLNREETPPRRRRLAPLLAPAAACARCLGLQGSGGRRGRKLRSD